MKPQPRVKISNKLKREICNFHSENRSLKQAEIATRFKVDRSTISKILSEKDKILAVDELSELSEANIEEKLISWINQRPSVISAEQIREKIRQICEDNPEISKQLAKRVLSLNWMKAFKRKHRFGIPCFQTFKPYVPQRRTSPASPQNYLRGSPAASTQDDNRTCKSNSFSENDSFSPFISTPISTASPVSCPAISDGGSVSIQNRLEPLKRLDFDDFERKQTQAPHHTANQRCGPKGLSSGFYQVPPADSPGPQLPPTSSFVVSPEPPQSWTNYHNVLQSSDSFSYAVDSGGSEHSRPTKENAQRAVETLLNYIDNGAGDVGDFLAVLNLTERLGLHKNGDFTM